LISTAELPTLNAALNTFSAALLCAGYLFIRRKNIRAHRACMLAAFACSTLFLISYLIYHYQVGSVPYKGQGWIRTVYFLILISHTILATSVAPLALITLVRALREKFPQHRRIARWTLPIWLYVSVTGVIVYLMLYRL
jgi:putative membrane protein